MSGFVRSSHYRHVFVEAPKIDETYKGFRLATTTGEQQYIKGNTQFFAVAVSGGGGPFAVVPYERTGMSPPGSPMVSGHKGAVLDFDFNPFHPNLVASASEDTSVKVWGIPPGGLTETITEPLVDLQGHAKKVTLLRFHPTANNVLGSVSADLAVKVWDIEKGVEMMSMQPHHELIQDLVWDCEGRTWATSSKDKVVRIGDPRAGTVVQEVPEAHTGSKSVKLAFLGESGKFVTLGFTKQSQRQMKIWDPKGDLTKPIFKLDIDQAAGVIMPYYDPDTRILFLAGKGDGNIRYYEMAPEKSPFVYPLSEYRSTAAAKGTCFIPKRACDVLKCETARCLKLTQKGTEGIIEPLSFIVPRKSDAFQEDIFPPTFSGIPSCTADDWLAGTNKMPLLASLDPALTTGGAKSPAANAHKAFSAVKTPAVLTKELQQAADRIKVLEERLKKAGLDAS